MIFDQVPEICDKCGLRHNTVKFLSLEGEPRICEKCMAEVFFGKEMKTNQRYLKECFNRPKKLGFWGGLKDK